MKVESSQQLQLEIEQLRLKRQLTSSYLQITNKGHALDAYDDKIFIKLWPEVQKYLNEKQKSLS